MTTAATRPSGASTPPRGWRGTWGFVRHFLAAYPRRTAVMVGLLVASGLAQGVGVVSVLPLLDIAVGERSADGGALRDAVEAALGLVGAEPTLGPLLVLIVAMMALRGLLLWFAMFQVGYTVARVAADLRLRLIRALSRARWDHFASQPSGHVATALSSEANRASWAYKEAVGGMAAAFEMLVNLTVVMVFSWQVGLLAIATGALVGGVLHGLVRLARRAGDEQTVQMRDLIGRMTELLPALKPVKAMHRERGLLHVLEQGTRAVDRAQRDAVLARESMTAAREPLLVLVMALGLYAALAVADLAFSAVLLLAIVFYRLMTRFGDLQTNYQTALLGESAFWSVMAQVEAAEAAREPATGTATAPALTDGLDLDGVVVQRGGRVVLDRVDVHLPPRALVVLVGPSGAGKSTLLDTLAGLHRPTAGRVLVDGTDLAEFDVGSWRRRIGYVPQEVVLLHDTVRANVAFGDDDVTDDDVQRALTGSGAAGFVANLPDGLDHVVGERGSRLSGGQQQRLAIARALVHDPDLLLLDEATSALDAETEQAIAETLLVLRERRLVVAIAHRGLLTEVADVVVEVAPGRVAVRDTTRGATA